MRTNIVLNEALVREASALTDIRTKRELIDLALQELIRSRRKKTCSILRENFSLPMISTLSNCANYGMILIDTSVWIHIFRDTTLQYSHVRYTLRTLLGFSAHLSKSRSQFVSRHLL
jgi:hypothetical protein